MAINIPRISRHVVKSFVFRDSRNLAPNNLSLSLAKKNFNSGNFCQHYIRHDLVFCRQLSTNIREPFLVNYLASGVLTRSSLSGQKKLPCYPFGGIKNDCLQANKVIYRTFRTTPPVNIPPLIWVVLQPIAKLTAMLTGRSVRKWWQALPQHRKVLSKDNLKKNWYWFALAGLSFSGLIYGYYRSHLQETPITHRVRFIPVTDEQAEKISQEEANMILEKFADSCLPTSHPYYKTVVEITRRLISANQDFPKIQRHTWKVTVIDAEERNAFVLPTGHIFVFTGLIETTQNADQLAIVLGHEMAHTLLSHSAEQLSFMQLVDWMIIAVMAAMWAIIPSDGIAVITQWFYHKIIDFTVHLPYSRKLEREADKVGLQLCAKACFDVRESCAFWVLMNCLSRLESEKTPEWLSTHPSNENRVTHLDFLMSKAIEQRNSCSCPKLPDLDPRERVKPMVKVTDSVVRALQTGANLQQVHVIQPREAKSA